MKNSSSMSSINCICGNFDEENDEFQCCSECDNKCHSSCYDLQVQEDPQDFFCLRCRLILGEPFKQIEKFLGKPNIIINPGDYQFVIELDQMDYNKIRQPPYNKIVIYCLGLKLPNKNKKNANILQWPSENIAISVNKEIIQYESNYLSEINPRFINSPEQKNNRIDVRILEKLKQKSVIGVALAKVLKVETLAQNILDLSMKLDEKTHEYSWDQNYRKWTENNELGIFLSLKDPITFKKINIPMRGAHCIHYNMVDLENFLNYYQSPQRTERWKCPICDKKIYWTMIVVDYYFYWILNQIYEKYKENPSKLLEIKELSMNLRNEELEYNEISEQKRVVKGFEQTQMELENQEEMKGNKDEVLYLPNPDWKKIQESELIQFLKGKFFEANKKYGQGSNQNLRQIIEAVRKEQEEFRCLSPLQAVLLLETQYDFRKKFADDIIQNYDQNINKTVAQMFKDIAQRQHLFIVSKFAISFAQDFNNIVLFVALIASNGKQIIKDGQQMHIVILLLISVSTQLLLQEEKELNTLFSTYFSGRQSHGAILGCLLREFCQVFKIESIQDIAKIVKRACGIVPELRFFPRLKSEIAKQEDNALNSALFLHELMRDRYQQIEEEWIPFLQLLYTPPYQNIENVDEQQETFQFVCFLKVLTHLNIKIQKQKKDTNSDLANFNLVTKELEKIIKLWDEDLHVISLLNNKKKNLDGFLDYIKCLKQFF